MIDDEQTKYIKYRMLQYIPTPIHPQEANSTIAGAGSTAVDNPAYNPSTVVDEPVFHEQESSNLRRKFKEKDSSVIIGGILLLLALFISAALIIYALARFVG